MSNTVEISSTGQVLVQEVARQAIEIIVPGNPITVEIITQGPQGVAGDATGLPTGGNPGNVLIKTSNANYDANWSAYVDGGTFN